MNKETKLSIFFLIVAFVGLAIACIAFFGNASGQTECETMLCQWLTATASVDCYQYPEQCWYKTSTPNPYPAPSQPYPAPGSTALIGNVYKVNLPLIANAFHYRTPMPTPTLHFPTITPTYAPTMEP